MTSKDPSLDVARRRVDEPSPTRLLRDGEFAAPSGSSDPEGEHVYRIEESQKLGITSSIFLILNKMIGTGSQFVPALTSFEKIRHNFYLQFSPRLLESLPRLGRWEFLCLSGCLVGFLNFPMIPMENTNMSRRDHYLFRSQRLPRVWITNTSIRGGEELSRACLSKAQISRHLGISLADGSARVFLWKFSRIWTICTSSCRQQCTGRMGCSWDCRCLYNLCYASPRHPSQMGHSSV